MSRARWWLVCVALLAGCPRAGPGASAGRDTGTAGQDSAPTRPAPVGFEACARVAPPPVDRVKPVTLAGVRLVLQGAVMRPAPHQRASSRRLVLGVLADTRFADEANVSRLRLLRDHLVSLGAHAIVVLGGLDATYEGTRALLGALHGRLPLLALPGDRASRSGFSGALENLGQGVVDFTLVRAVVHPAATLVGVPGYHLTHHLRAEVQGCSYDREDLAEVATLALTLPAPRILLSHGPPRAEGPGAVDRALGGINAGDPALTRLLGAGKFQFGLAAHLHEAGGHATTLAGAPVAPGDSAEGLLLNVGSADRVPHENLRRGTSSGTAALITLDHGIATHRVIDLDDLGKPAEKNRNN